MSGRPNSKWMETMIRKHGSREAVRLNQQMIGRRGGQNGTTGGFASTTVGKDGLTGRERASKVGVLGGRNGKPSPRKKRRIVSKETSNASWQNQNLIDSPSTLKQTHPCASCGKIYDVGVLNEAKTCSECSGESRRFFDFLRRKS